MSYKDLLLDPRWQRKRLEVLERENFTCQDCGATDKTLHVHHTYYAKGRKPWEYDASELRCLCAICHGATGEELTVLSKLVGSLDEGQRAMVRGYVTTLIAMDSAGDVAITITDYLFGLGASAALRVSTDDLRDACDNDGVVHPKGLHAIAYRRKAQWEVLDAIDALDNMPVPVDA